MNCIRFFLCILLCMTFAPLKAEEAAALPPGSEAYTKTAIIGIEAGASFIRLSNFLEQPTRNYVEVYGVADRAALGGFTVEVPAKATVQFQPEHMFETFASVNWNQPIVLYVENGRDKQVWQHIKFDNRSRIFSDAGVCASPPALSYITPGNVAIDVFTNASPRFTSEVTVHNFSDEDAHFEARVYDAATGQIASTRAFALGGRQSLTTNGLFYAPLGDRLPPADKGQFMNVEFVQVGGNGAHIVVSHEVLDSLSQTTLNLSNPCSIHGGLVSAF